LIQRAWSRVLADGATLHADLRLPEGYPPNGVILLLHGFKGFKDWGFFPWLAEALTRAGFATVTPNFSLNGVGPGSRDFDDLEGFARNTFTREQEEITYLVEALASGEVFPDQPQRLGLFGHSRGGGQAILAAKRHHADALVTWAAVASFHRWTAEEKARWHADGRIHVSNQRTGQAMPLDKTLLEDLDRHSALLDIEEAAQTLRMPWLLVHGTADPVVSVMEADCLAARTPAARALLLAGTGHTFDATHPMGEVSAALRKAAEATVDHFTTHLHGQKTGV